MATIPKDEMTAENAVAVDLREELDARVRAWEAERETLLQAQERIARLDELIAHAKGDDKTLEYRVATQKEYEELSQGIYNIPAPTQAKTQPAGFFKSLFSPKEK